MKTPAKRRTGEVTASNVSTEQAWCTGESAYTGESITINRRIRFQRSTNRLVHRRIGVHVRIDYHYSAYQIPTFNTTDWYTGESACTGESITINRRIRFQRSTQQISTPANRRTRANRLPSFGVSDSNVPTSNTTD